MDLLTIEQARKRLGISDATMRRWLRAGRIKAELIRGKYYFSEQDINRLVSEQKREDGYAVTTQQVEDLKLLVSSLDLELLKLRERVEQLEQLRERVEQVEQRLERSEKREKPTMKEKEAPSPVKHDTDQQIRVSAPSGGTIASHTFAELHDINKRTMSDYLAGERFNDRIESEVIGRSGSKLVRGLTPDQQHQAILFFQRHGVRYTPCPQCPHEPEQEQG